MNTEQMITDEPTRIALVTIRARDARGWDQIWSVKCTCGFTERGSTERIAQQQAKAHERYCSARPESVCNECGFVGGYHDWSRCPEWARERGRMEG